MIRIDINCDVGEGVDNEAQLMPFISSCNIACGGHAGDAETIAKVMEYAIQNKVKIGAHPSYPDRKNFGRKEMEMQGSTLSRKLTQQITLVKTIAEAKGKKLQHVKPHGALYNKAAVDEATAQIIINAIAMVDDSLVLYAPYNSVLQELARGVLSIKIEGFADRNYNSDYTLVSRSQEQALITRPEAVMKHIYAMVAQGKLHSITGDILPIKIDTLCVHGDTPFALEIVKHIYEQAASYQISVR